MFYLHATDCLKILGCWLYQHGIALAIAEYYEKTLLPACCGKDACCEFGADSYLYIVRALTRAALTTQEKAGRELTREEMISAMLKLLGL